MKNGTEAGEQEDVCRQDVYEEYLNYYLELGAEIRPCRDARLLEKAAQYLLRGAEPPRTFTVFPFYQAVTEVTEGCDTLSIDCRKHLSAFIKATELLETLCVNLFLQPWKKEIKTLKTFTGPFVYCLLPVLSRSTIQSVLTSIGYVPHTKAPQSEFRLSEDANTDRAILVGFELLLARVECYHLLELLEKDQLGPQECLEVLQRRVQPTKLMEQMGKKTMKGQKEDEEQERKKEEVPLYLDTRLAANPNPKLQCCHLISVDQSIMEMQKTYPDLAFRGRPLLTEEPHRAQNSVSSSKAVHTAELPKKHCIKGPKAAAKTIISRNDGSKADQVLGDSGKSSGCNDKNSGETTARADTISSSDSSTDGRVDNELGGPQAVSLQITLRTGPRAEQSLKPKPTAEPSVCTQQQADGQHKRLATTEVPHLNSMDEEQELTELADRMEQLCVQENKDEVKIKGEENTNNERRKKETKSSTETGREATSEETSDGDRSST
uniref:Spermatogenesis-associated protein 2 PUB-like domain-containing protein n=1 Tax=Amphiprion percula TaxID=161767 RepID=A0A3P8RV72_AMPPE